MSATNFIHGDYHNFYLPPLKHAEELESFCEAFSFKINDGFYFLNNLKKFLNTNESLKFEKTNESDPNSSIIVSQVINGKSNFSYILKQVSLISQKRLNAIEEMISNKNDHFIPIIKDAENNYMILLGESLYLSFEYLKPDINSVHTLEHMFIWTANFHEYSEKYFFNDENELNSLQIYLNQAYFNINEEIVQVNPTLFKSKEFELTLKFAKYFSSESFFKIYNSLPTRFIHGNISPSNIILNKSKFYFFDYEKIRNDIRLLDFAKYCGSDFLEKYLDLSKQNKLFLCLNVCYGSLDPIEIQYFHLITMFGRCFLFNQFLGELESALNNNNFKKVEELNHFLEKIIKEIISLYTIPQLQEFIQ